MRFKELIKFIIQKKYIVNEGVWSIVTIESDSAITFNDLSNEEPVITAKIINDVKAEFVADPFLIKDDEKYYMFYEILDSMTCKGVIGVSESFDGKEWRYRGVVLREDFHLSYPQVFKINDQYYMIPESHESEEVRVYKAEEFPYTWKFEKAILNGKYLDNSIFEYRNIFWMFSEKIEDNNDKSLRLFSANNILGKWEEHPKSPIIYNNLELSRPAGSVMKFNDELYRFSQDCSERYGKSITAFKINNLTLDEYEEEVIGNILGESNKHNTWNKDGMHTVNSIKKENGYYISCVDGYYLRKKNLIISKLKREFYKFIVRVRRYVYAS